MVAHNRIRCLVVSVPVSSDRLNSSGALARDVLPWADPYVAGLIKKLQDEFNMGRMLCWFNPGGQVPHVQVMRSMELFAAKVMPGPERPAWMITGRRCGDGSAGSGPRTLK